MNGWLLVRIAGIVVGIATLLRVATNEGIVAYDPLFLAWMDRLRDIVELGFLTDLIGPFLHWGIDFVRSWGISVPDLQDEWRPAFVFSMLMFAATTRHIRSGLLVAAAPVGAFVVAFWSGLSGTLAPVIAAAAGTAAAVLAAVASSAYAASTPAENRSISAAATAFAAFACGTAAVYVAVGNFIFPAVLAATGIATAAFYLLLAGMVDGQRSGGVLANANFNMGIDVLFTMASAFLIAVAVANPPIW